MVKRDFSSFDVVFQYVEMRNDALRVDKFDSKALKGGFLVLKVNHYRKMLVSETPGFREHQIVNHGLAEIGE